MTGPEMMQEAEAGRLVLLDVRPAQAFGRGHVARAMSAPYAQRGWGQAVHDWLVQQGRPAVALLADNAVVAGAAAKALAQLGIEPSAVWAEGPEAWQRAGLPVVTVPDITADQLAAELGDWVVIDVREPYEWRSGIIPGAATIPMGQLPDQLTQLDKAARYAIVCASGNRSQAAAAHMADRGYQVANVRGGMSLWLAAQHPTDRPRG